MTHCAVETSPEMNQICFMCHLAYYNNLDIKWDFYQLKHNSRKIYNKKIRRKSERLIKCL